MGGNLEHCEQENMVVNRDIDDDNDGIVYTIDCAECGERVASVKGRD